jgi:two-component system response regulator FixJ
LAQLDDLGQGCVIIDVRMGKMDGLQLQQELNDAGCNLPLIFITAHGDVSGAVRALKSGAIDFIEKPFDDELLIGTVCAALQRVRPNHVAPIAERALALEAEAARPAAVEQTSARVAALSPRERQVLGFLVAGLSNKAIARELSLSPRTVEIHRGNIMRRLGARNLAHVVQMALAGGIKGVISR